MIDWNTPPTTPEEAQERSYVSRVVDVLMTAEANGYSVDDLAQAAIERARQIRAEEAVQR